MAKGANHTIQLAHQVGKQTTRALRLVTNGEWTQLRGLNRHGVIVCSQCLEIHYDDIPALIAGLEYLIAGPLTRVAIEQEAQPPTTVEEATE